jgi:putative hydrolase of the HAD superfamily
MKSYDNFLFDLYGTLVDIHTDEEDPILWRQMSVLLQTEGINITPEALHKKYLTTIHTLESKAKDRLGSGVEIDIKNVFFSFYDGLSQNPSDEKIDRLAHIFRILSTHKLRLFPGVSEMLTELKATGKKVFLLSNAQTLFTMPELCALQLEQYFDGIVISSAEGYKKPDRRLYRLVIERYSLNPQKTVMVGNDDVADCWGAADAGLDSMYIYTEQSPLRRNPLPDNCVELNKISDLLSIKI